MLKIEASSPPDDPMDVLPLDGARVTVEMFTADAERPSIVSADFQYLSFKDNEYVWSLMGGNLRL